MKSSALKLSISGLLIAVGIVIPMMSPLKIILEPASFTLASHVTIFIAMFISPGMAAAVAIGTTIGFFLGAFPIVIVFRAASHLVFATLGGLWIRKNPKLIDGGLSLRVFSFVIGLIHGVCELVVVMVFYFGGSMSEAYYAKGFPWLVAMVGLGTVVHSMVDLEIAYLVITPLKSRIKTLAGVTS